MSLLFFGIILFSAFTHGFTGLGFGIVIMACLAVSPWTAEVTAAYSTILVIFIFFVIILAERKAFKPNWHIIGLLLVGQAFGIVVGYQFIHYHGERDVFHFFLGLILIVFGTYQLIRPPVYRCFPYWVGFAAGSFAGFCTGAFTSGGPPIALYLYSSINNALEAKWTMQIIFLLALTWRLLNIAFFSNIINYEFLTSAATFLPFVLAFTVLGHRISRYLSPRKFAIAVNALIMFSGFTHIGMALT